MTSQLYRINWKDFLNGLIVAVGGAVLMFVLDLLKIPGFDYYKIPWDEIGRVALLALGSYLSRKFFSTTDGKLFGKI